MNTVIVIAVFICAFSLDYIPDRAQKSVKEKWIYFIMLSVSLSVLVVNSLHITVPSPTKPITAIVEKFIPLPGQ